MRVVVANEPRSYRQLLAGVLQRLRPAALVWAAEPGALDGAIARLRPHLVVSSRLTASSELHPISWVLLYPGGENRVVTCVAGNREEREDIGVEELLSVLDRTELIASRR